MTTAADSAVSIEKFFGQGRFLHPAFSEFYRDELLELLSNHGTPCRMDQQGKYFPVTDQASDVLAALARYAKGNGVQIRTDVTVTDLQTEPSLTVLTSQGAFHASAVIVTTGGQTYQATGSTGDGYQLALQLGHTIQRIRPALVALNIRETEYRELAGLSLDDVKVMLYQDGEKPACERGDILLTHKGVSGPAILRVSRQLLSQGRLEINLKPDLKHEALSQQILQACSGQPRQQLKNVLDRFIPHRLVEPLLTAAKIPLTMQAAQVSRSIAGQVATALQQWTLTVTGHAGQHLAMVTAGGVSLNEITPKTMASKIVPGLYFAGEVLDLDGDTGGFNLQAAFSTGYLAGQSAAARWHDLQ